MRITTKGQVTIPGNIREVLGITPEIVEQTKLAIE